MYYYYCVNKENAHHHAVYSAYVSIVCGLIALVLSVISTLSDVSASVLGVALMAFADISGSCLVLYIWRFSGSSTTNEVILQEVLVVYRRLVLISRVSSGRQNTRILFLPYIRDNFNCFRNLFNI